MSERDELLISVANEIRTYREGEIVQPTPDHVNKWLCQFSKDSQLLLIKEFLYTIKRTFIPKNRIEVFLSNLIDEKNIVGFNPVEYWSSANFLNIQEKGKSQESMLDIFNFCLKSKYNINLDDCGNEKGDYIYLDDLIFSGERISQDVEKWIRTDAPEEAKLHIIVYGWHTLGQFWMKNRLNNALKETKKKINVWYWRNIEFENRKSYKNSSQVLWPTRVPNVPEVQNYIESDLLSKFPFEPRNAISKNIFPFSSEVGREVLEQEFLIAGAKIRAKCKNPSPLLRPLGFSKFGVGFGSLMVTYRNCPNNCPLAIWWGNSETTQEALDWDPLLPRKIYYS